MSNGRKNLHTILAIATVIILAGILYVVYTQSNSTDKYYKETLTKAENYIQQEDWDSALIELKHLDGIQTTNSKLIQKKELDVSSCHIHKQLNNSNGN